MLAFSPKNPVDVDDFRVNLPLGTDETVQSITTVTITPIGGLSESIGDRIVDTTGLTMRLSGGVVNVDYKIAIKYVTTAARTKARTVRLPVKDC